MRIRDLTAVLLLLSFIACGRDERRVGGAGPQQSAGATPVDGGTLVRRLDTDVRTLNPLRVSGAHERYVQKFLFTPIVYLDREMKAVPGLARSWTISPDGRLYRFELDARATFSDGTPVRASDVLFTLRKVADPRTEAPQISNFFVRLDLTRTHVVGDHTIEVAFHEAWASQLLHFADLFVIPEHVYAKGDFNNDFNDMAVGSGPYKLLSRQAGKEIVVERRNDYWRERPHITTVIFRVVSDHQSGWNALKLGQIDETNVTSDLWLRERSNPTLTGAIDFHLFYRIGYNFIGWNTRRPLLADKRIRRALAMCIPTNQVIGELFHSTARPVSGPFVKDEYAFNPSVPAVPFDLPAASRIFAEEGWVANQDGVLQKNGTPFAFELLLISGNATSASFAQAVQSEMKKAGVQLEIRSIDAAACIQRLRAGEFDAAYMAWELDADPDPSSLFHTTQFPPRGQNFVFYSNPGADRLMDEARRELNFGKRRALYQELHRVVAEDQPYAWLLQSSTKWAVNKRVRGVSISPGYGPYLWYPGEFAWWIAAEEHRGGG